MRKGFFLGGRPAFEGVHEFSLRLQAFAHEMRLLANNSQGFLEQAGLLLRYLRIRHGHE